MAENLGTAALYLTVDTSQMDVAIERAKQRVSGMSAQAQQEYAKLSKAEKRRVDSLIRQADTLGFTRQQQIAYDAALKTHGTVLDDITRRLARQSAATTGVTRQVGQQASAFNAGGKSAKEMAFAMRGLPAQLTDIGVSLASGQRPMMVFLQQGGQLKDMFGGIGPAANALSTAIRGMITPTTLAVGAVGLLGAAWLQAEDQAAAFERTIAKTGGFLNLTVEQLQALAADLDELPGVTSRSASRAIVEIAETSRFTAEQLEIASRAAVQWERATKTAVKDTIAEFEKLRKDPVAAILELNETYHNFLTRSQLDHIENLRNEGREMEAQNAAFRAYAGMIDERAPKIAQNLGLISGAFSDIKSGAAEAFDAIVTGIQDADRQAKESAERIARFLRSLAFLKSGPAGIFGVNASLVDPAPVQQTSDAVSSPAERARIEAEKEWGRLVESNLSKRVKLEMEVLRIMDLGIKAGKSQAEIAKQVAEARQRYKESLPKPQKSEEEKAAEKLAKAFETQNEQLTRSIFLHGQVGRAAAISYDIQFGALAQLSMQQKAILQEQAQWLDWLDDMAALDAERAKVAQDATNARLKAAADSTDKLTEFSRQAARNMQDDFADFLFDPFKDGADGMVDAFGNALRRMAAEMAASRVFETLANWGSSNSGSGGIVGAIAGFFGSLKENALGGVYNSPSLSAYSGKVYDSPQLFKFAKGAGIFGEAGAEAIMPLKRMTNGKLGVQATGNDQISIEINNFGGAKVSAREERMPGLDGESMRKIVIDIAADDMASGGRLAGAAKSRFGLREMV